MSTYDTCCTLVPYFKIQDGKLDEFRTLCEEFIEKTKTEKECLYYGFSFNGNEVHCREGYKSAEGLLAHLDNVGELLEKALQISEITRLEIHGVESELSILREPLSNLNPEFFTLKYGFRH